MIENIKFTFKDGKHNPGDVVVYALSTCGHCKRALNFLDSNSVKYRFVYVEGQLYSSVVGHLYSPPPTSAYPIH
jgi:hypothetical protein